ncbi:hypothetical protein PYCC9005_000448 [Savitreella phatthalungensis]
MRIPKSVALIIAIPTKAIAATPTSNSLDELRPCRARTSALTATTTQLPSPTVVQSQEETTTAGSSCAVAGVGETGFAVALTRAAMGGDCKEVVVSGRAVIDAAIVMTDLKDLTITFTGSIELKADLAYWTKNSSSDEAGSRYWSALKAYQNNRGVFVVGGSDVRVRGRPADGTADKVQYFGHGDILSGATDKPVLFHLYNCTRCEYSGFHHVDPPFWSLMVANSQQVNVSDYAATVSGDWKNTDGIDLYQSQDVMLQNLDLQVTDDCIAVKGGTSKVSARGIQCGKRCHGVSVGSLGQYTDTTPALDSVRDVVVEDVTLTNCTYGARLKSWTGDTTGKMHGGLTGGGGSAEVVNIAFRNFTIVNGQSAAIVLDTCYGGDETSPDCNGHSSKVSFENVMFDGFRGETTGHKGRFAELVCSGVCKNVTVQDFKCSGSAAKCDGLDKSLLTGLQCTSLTDSAVPSKMKTSAATQVSMPARAKNV